MDIIEARSRGYALGMFKDEQVFVELKKSGWSRYIGGDLFDGCEISYDPEFKSVTIEARGYEVIIDLGNTPDWTTPSTCGGHDDALLITVLEEGELDEDNAVKKISFPVIE
jgi:hypothetical protein